MLVDLDIHAGTCVCYVLSSWLPQCSWRIWIWHSGQTCSSCIFRVFGLPLKLRGLGLLEGRWHTDLLSVSVVHFVTAFLVWKPSLCLWEGQELPSSFLAPSWLGIFYCHKIQRWLPFQVEHYRKWIRIVKLYKLLWKIKRKKLKRNICSQIHEYIWKDNQNCNMCVHILLLWFFKSPPPQNITDSYFFSTTLLDI